MERESTADLIRRLCRLNGISVRELGRRMGTSGQNVSNKLSRDNFTEKELNKIAKALDYTYHSYFTDQEDNKFE